MVKLLFFRFQNTNSRLKNNTTMGALLFCHFRVTNVKLINEKISLDVTVWILVNPYQLILLLLFLRTSYKRLPSSCSKVVVAWMWSPTYENLSNLSLGTTSLLVSETFKFKNFETWLPATYNNGRQVNY